MFSYGHIIERVEAVVNLSDDDDVVELAMLVRELAFNVKEDIEALYERRW